LLIVVLALWLWRAEPRRWVRNLGYLALAAVVTQGILGGITVLWYLPDPISIAHASLAEIVFCLTVAIALVESPGWKRAYVAPPDDRLLQKLAIATVAVVYIQILMGATMRHTNAGLAIPDFPLAFGHVIPPHWDPRIAIHFAHRVGALFVTAFLLAATGHIFYHHRDRPELVRPSILLLVLLALQITLGALTVLSGKQPVINSFHVVTGASVFVTSVVLALRSHRARFADVREYVGRVPPQADAPGLPRPEASANARSAPGKPGYASPSERARA
jgi:cytochrome c oxidase assembly protein subunit 15